MSNGGSSPNAEPNDLPEADVKARKRFSIVWLIPLVAAAIAIYLGYTTLSEQGPTITMTFKTAAGLEAGKTRVKYKDVEMGVVTKVDISDDLATILVTAQMEKSAQPHLNENTRFWVVRPRLSTSGVSGLETLVSGAHIEMDPGKGDSARQFTGLEDPPVIRADVPGSEFTLRANQRGSLAAGAPISFRGIQVGQIMAYELGPDGRGVNFLAFIMAPHDRLVRPGTQFWNASGINVSIGATGVRVQTESLVSIVTGGVAFETPISALDNEPSPRGSEFPLYANETATKEAAITEQIPFIMHFEGSVRGLETGAPVELRGIKVGEVTDIRLIVDREAKAISVPVTIVLEPERVTLMGIRQTDPVAAMGELVQRGMRAQLKSGSLLTGALYVDLDFYPDAPPAEMARGGRYAELPTIPSDIEQIKRSAGQVLDRVAALPLEDLIQDMRTMIQSVNALVSSPAVKSAEQALLQTAEAAEQLMTQANQTLASAGDLISPGSPLRYDLTQALTELRTALRSLRQLAEYLERHPEALVRGKGAPAR
ncbi:MAG: MCE family protein [Rhodospirillales bacterium]|nr:MCE family protein [Rhodospirillales bacterium]